MINFSKGLIPAIIQDNKSQTVLMLGYMNEDAFTETQKTNTVTFYSRSKQRLWQKGETSGNTLSVNSIHIDCDQDSILIMATPAGPTCHTGTISCFFKDRELRVASSDDSSPLDALTNLEQIIEQRKTDPQETSYTSSLFNSGLNKIAQKVGEEAVEVVIAAINETPELFKQETADLLFHLLVLISEKGLGLADIVAVLGDRGSK